MADEEIVLYLERLFNPCTYLSATGEVIVTEQLVTDIKTAVEFFNKDPTILVLDRHEDGIHNVCGSGRGGEAAPRRLEN